MDGIINILKPPGMTSFDVVGYLRGVLKTRKIGHTGTLDPGAVGVLPICVGNATKAIEYMTDKDKLYRAELTLGTETDTQDSTGQVIKTSEVNVSSEEIVDAIRSFVGKIQQIPPMYSAVKVDGKKLYELARSGITIERKPREIEIYSIDIVGISENKKIMFDVACSKGTYIRTLCADIGTKLGCGGHMSFLIRLKAGIFDIESAVTLEDISSLSNSQNLNDIFIPVDEVFTDMDKVVLGPADEKKLLNGAFIGVLPGKFNQGEVIRVYSNSGKFIALGELITRQDKLLLKSKKVF